MSGTSPEGTHPRLGPVLGAAMNDLTTLVYDSHVTRFLRPRHLTTHYHLDGPEGTGRAACVAMFKHLKHFGVEWETAALCEWATRRGWVAKDVALLCEFGNGIQSGSRFHTSPEPWGRFAVKAWLEGVSMYEKNRPTRSLKIKSCCRNDAEPPPSRAAKLARSSGRFMSK